jgi:hypothetical protein
MTESEAQETFLALITAMERSRLLWVIEQVRQEISLGKTSSKTLSVSPEEFGILPRPRKQRVKFLSTEEYSHKEQVLLVLDAIEQTVVASAEMQNEILSFTRVRDVRFTSDDGTGERSIITARSEREKSVVERLRIACDQLREELKTEKNNGF